jgi:hypothetical protein
MIASNHQGHHRQPGGEPQAQADTRRRTAEQGNGSKQNGQHRQQHSAVDRHDRSGVGRRQAPQHQRATQHQSRENQHQNDIRIGEARQADPGGN